MLKKDDSKPAKTDVQLEALNSQRRVMVDRIKRREGDLISLNTLIGTIQEKAYGAEFTAPTPEATRNLLYAAGVTRFGVLAIVIYLVQILINLYRYNVQVAGFYMGQADALLLLDHSAKKIRALSRAMSPGIDFGRTPQALPERILKQFKEMAEAAYSRVGKKQKEKQEPS